MHVHSVILKPRFPYVPEIIAGKVSQIESYMIRINRVWEDGYPEQLVREKNDNDNIKKIVSGDSITVNDENLNESIWTIQLSDIPAGGKNSVLIQNILEATIYETDDVIGYLDELGYMHESEFWTNGLRFYYGNVIIELTQIYVIDPENPQLPTTSESNDVIEINTVTNTTDTDTDIKIIDSKNLKKNLKLFNTLGSYHLKTFVNVGALNDIENISIGVKQLENLKKELSETVTLKIPDRTLMDSRINSRIANTGMAQKN